MAHIVTPFNTKGNTAKYVATQPAADYTHAPLRARRFESRARGVLPSTVGTFDFYRISAAIDARDSLIPLHLLGSQKLSKSVLSLINVSPYRRCLPCIID